MTSITKNIWSADSNVTETDVLTVLKSSNISVQHITKLDSGWDSFVYLINKKQIVKIAKRKTVAIRFHEEIEFLKLLQGRFNVKVPRYNLIIECPLAGGLLIGYPLISGESITVDNPNSLKVLTEIVKFCSIYHKLPNKNKINLTNSIDLNVFKANAIEAKKVIWEYLSSAEKSLLDKVTSIDIHPSGSLQVCIHNDLRPTHIIIKKSQIGIIDWTDVAWAEPWLDFLWLWIYWGENLYPILSNKYQDWNIAWEKYIAIVGIWKCALEYYFGLQTNDSEKIGVTKLALNRVLIKSDHPVYSQFLS